MALDTESGSPLQCSSMVYVSKESCVHKWNEPCLLLLLSSRHYCPLFFCYLFCAMALCLSVCLSPVSVLLKQLNIRSHSNLAFILIFAIFELWLIQQ